GARMMKKLAPPGRTSNSACGVVYGRGAIHCLNSSGWVQAAYTFSRGALMTRVRTRSRPETDVCVLEVESGSEDMVIEKVNQVDGHGRATSRSITQRMNRRRPDIGPDFPPLRRAGTDAGARGHDA